MTARSLGAQQRTALLKPTTGLPQRGHRTHWAAHKSRQLREQHRVPHCVWQAQSTAGVPGKASPQWVVEGGLRALGVRAWPILRGGRSGWWPRAGPRWAVTLEGQVLDSFSS